MLTRPFPLGAPQAKPDSVRALLRQRRSINKPFNSLIFRLDLVCLMQHCLNSYKSALRLPSPPFWFCLISILSRPRLLQVAKLCRNFANVSLFSFSDLSGSPTGARVVSG